MQPIQPEILACVNDIADAARPEREMALERLRITASAENVNVAQSNALRPIDILARGVDDEISAAAVEVLIDAGAIFTSGPGAHEAPPLHAACYHGNWMIARAIMLYEGVDPDQPGSSRSMRLNAGTPAHAVAVGFRSAHSVRYMYCLQVLLANGADLNKIDRMRKKPVDIALAGLVSTNDRTLVDALFEYGVMTSADASQAPDASAAEVARAIASRQASMYDLGVAAVRAQMRDVIRKVPKSSSGTTPA
jgi:hypothetical protein